MTGILRRIAQTTAVAGAVALAAAAGAGTAAADEWPVPPPYPSPITIFDNNNFLTPTDLEYWNPFATANRLTSPFGLSTKIVCTGFHGQIMGCWQADLEGNPHQLHVLPVNFPGSIMPNGVLNHFVYPGFIPGS